jgi:hypothetical protein
MEESSGKKITSVEDMSDAEYGMYALRTFIIVAGAFSITYFVL